MKRLLASKGKIVLVDNSDFERLIQYHWESIFTIKDDRWSISRSVNIYCICCKRRVSARVFLAREIMHPPPHLFVDHRDGNTLDNRKRNLRIATASQNAANRRIGRRGRTITKGVHRRESGRWRALIRVNGVLIHLGTYDTEAEAAKKYAEAAKKYFGEFANAAQS